MNLLYRCLLFTLLFSLNSFFNQLRASPSKEMSPFFRQPHLKREQSLLELPTLTNIQQITSPSMGFDLAKKAQFSPDGSSIIFQALPKGENGCQIYIMDLQDKHIMQVSSGLGACTSPNFNSDGNKIIFSSSLSNPILNDPDDANRSNRTQKYECSCNCRFIPYMNLYLADRDGTELTALTIGPHYYTDSSFSPDGSKITYISNISGCLNIYVMNADGSDIIPLTSTESTNYRQPTFSPDGSKILFQADFYGDLDFNLYTIHADGSDLQRLSYCDAINWSPAWHPNGKAIVFTSTVNGHCQLYLLNIHTGAQYRLTHCPRFDGLPVFNRWGTKIIWSSTRGPDRTKQLFMADFTLPPEFE